MFLFDWRFLGDSHQKSARISINNHFYYKIGLKELYVNKPCALKLSRIYYEFYL